MGENMIDFDKVFPLVYPSPQQDPKSLKFLADLLNEFEPKTILEIGTGCGALTTMLALSGAKVVSVDQRDNPMQYWEHLIHEGKIKAEDVDITFHKANSQIQETADLVKGIYDWVLIDADHSWAGGLKDWDLYSKMANVVGIHDIAGYDDKTKNNDKYDWFPTRKWHQLKRTYNITRETPNLPAGGWGFIFK